MVHVSSALNVRGSRALVWEDSFKNTAAMESLNVSVDNPLQLKRKNDILDF